jgi:hypothetical protein
MNATESDWAFRESSTACSLDFSPPHTRKKNDRMHSKTERSLVVNSDSASIQHMQIRDEEPVVRLQTSIPFMLPSKPGASANEAHSSIAAQGFEEWGEEAAG